jgi:PBP1b-binding outer membrane lipoprotein LpoB
MAKRPSIAAAVLLALLLAGCANGASPGPNVPRNGAGQPVDPQTGLPLPGTPAPGGGY